MTHNLLNLLFLFFVSVFLLFLIVFIHKILGFCWLSSYLLQEGSVIYLMSISFIDIITVKLCFFSLILILLFIGLILTKMYKVILLFLGYCQVYIFAYIFSIIKFFPLFISVGMYSQCSSGKFTGFFDDCTDTILKDPKLVMGLSVIVGCVGVYSYVWPKISKSLFGSSFSQLDAEKLQKKNDLLVKCQTQLQEKQDEVTLLYDKLNSKLDLLSTVKKDFSLVKEEATRVADTVNQLRLDIKAGIKHINLLEDNYVTGTDLASQYFFSSGCTSPFDDIFESVSLIKIEQQIEKEKEQVAALDYVCKASEVEFVKLIEYCKTLRNKVKILEVECSELTKDIVECSELTEEVLLRRDVLMSSSIVEPVVEPESFSFIEWIYSWFF